MSYPVERGAQSVRGLYTQPDNNSPTTPANQTLSTGASGKPQYTGSAQNPSVPALEFHTNPATESRGATVGSFSEHSDALPIIDVVLSIKDRFINQFDESTTIQLISRGILPTSLLETLTDQNLIKSKKNKIVLTSLLATLKTHPKQGWNTLISELGSGGYNRHLKDALISGIRQKFSSSTTPKGLFNNVSITDHIAEDKQLTAVQKTIISHLPNLRDTLRRDMGSFCNLLFSQGHIDSDQKDCCTWRSDSNSQKALSLLNILIGKEEPAYGAMFSGLIQALYSQGYSEGLAETLNKAHAHYAQRH
ncbi:MAG: hypothetical protein HAW66_04635 [Shewanella sp.]|nr:hypothetical protein [Shewanella sp.]